MSLVTPYVSASFVDTHPDLTDMVAKESSDSNASTHPMHDVENNATSGGKATAQDHSANPVSHHLAHLPSSTTDISRQGPVMAEGLGEPASKDELKKRAAELNK